MKNGLFLASAHGALAGLIYGICEYIAAVVLAPLPSQPGALAPDHWIWEAWSLFIYVMAGAAIGGATAIFRHIDPPRVDTRSMVEIGLLALVCGRLLSHLTMGSNLVLNLALVLMAALTGQKELYDLNNDPTELYNLSDREQATTEQLSHDFDQWLRRIPAERTSPPAADAEDIKRLRSLGYVQ